MFRKLRDSTVLTFGQAERNTASQIEDGISRRGLYFFPFSLKNFVPDDGAAGVRDRPIHEPDWFFLAASGWSCNAGDAQSHIAFAYAPHAFGHFRGNFCGNGSMTAQGIFGNAEKSGFC